MSRPEKPNEEKLSRAVAFRLTELDYLLYKRKFDAAGVKQSQFFRDNVLSNRTQVVSRAPSPSTAQRAVFLLAKASNNLNQLAHRANSAHLAGQLSGESLGAICIQLEQLNAFLFSLVNEIKK